MGFLTRRSASRPPRDLARLLAEWREARFDGHLRTGEISPETAEFRDEIMGNLTAFETNDGDLVEAFNLGYVRGRQYLDALSIAVKITDPSAEGRLDELSS